MPVTVVLVGRHLSSLLFAHFHGGSSMKYLTSSFRVRLPFTFPLLVRYVLITLLLTGFVLGCWSAITPTAHAASHAATTHRHATHRNLDASVSATKSVIHINDKK